MIRGGLLALVLLWAWPADAQDFSVPGLTGAVVDDAHMLSPGTRQKLDTALRNLWNAGGSQIAVLTVENLGGLEIEQASIKVVDQWKLGTAKGDNGVLLLVAKTERSARIEVGQGLEGDLPDAYARRIIDDVLIPHFKQGDYDGGVTNAVFAIAQRTDPERQLGIGAAPARRDMPRDSNPLFPFFVFLLVMGFSLIPRILGLNTGHRGRRGGYWSSGGWGGGGGGWGGGGGFSGGGGGFSGGGASGKW